MCANKMDIPESGAVFTIGQTYLSDNHQSYFFIKNDKVKKLICGNRQSAVVCESGRLFVWGENQYGQLGIGTTITATKPTCVKAIKALKLKVQDVCYGDSFCIILTDANRIFYSGKCILPNIETYNNLLKKFTNEITTKPIEITELIYSNINSNSVKLKTISAGVSHFTYLTENGKVFSTNAEAAIDKNLDLPNDNIEIKTNWFICPDELVKNVEHASCGKYSTVIVTSENIIYIYGQINQLAFSKFTQIDVKQFITDEILSIHISKMDEIYVITKSGKIFKSNINHENEIEFLLINLLKDDEKILKLVTGDNFIVVITEKGKLYTSFIEGQMTKLNDNNNNNNCSNENLKELSKLQRLNVNFISSGMHHYLAHALPLESTNEKSHEVVLPPLNLKNAEIFKSDMKMERHLNLPEANTNRLSPRRENIYEEIQKSEEPNEDTEGRQSTHSVDTVIEANINKDKSSEQIGEGVKTSSDTMENKIDNNLNEQVTMLNRTYSAKSTAFLLNNAVNKSNQRQNEIGIETNIDPVSSIEDEPNLSAEDQNKISNEAIMNKTNEHPESGRISLDSMHPNIGSAMSKTIINVKELKAPSSAHEMKQAHDIIQESQMLQDFDEEINEIIDKPILFNKRPSLKYLDRSISQDKLDEIAKRIDMKSVNDTSNSNVPPVRIFKIESNDIENIINSDQMKANDNLEIVRLKDKENNEEVYFIIKNENLNIQNPALQTSSSEEESCRSNDVRFINNGIDVTDTVTLNNQGIIMLKQNANISSNSDSSDTGISTAKSSDDLEDTLLGEELSKLPYQPVRDSKMETQERLRQVVIEDKLSPIDTRHRVKTPLPKQGFSPMDESDDDDEKTTATINSKSGENPFDSDDENINQIIKDEIEIDKSDKQKEEGGKVKKIFNEIKTNIKEISCRNVNAVETDLEKNEAGQAQQSQQNNGKTSKVCTIL